MFDPHGMVGLLRFCVFSTFVVTRKQLKHCRYPVVFIVTDGPQSPVAKLFPKHLTTTLNIHTIRLPCVYVHVLCNDSV